MCNITDFVKIRGGKTFAELPFTPVDAAVLCQLSYLKFEYMPDNASLLDSLSAEGRERLFEDDRFGDLQRELYFEAVFSRRYRDMRIGFVISEKLEYPELCFCAMMFYPVGGAPVVVFRGTDEYVIGWKEDFNMAFMAPVPSQLMSADYLSRAAERLEGPFFVCGHSKGGNLAVYSAVCSPAEVRDRIKLVYNLDGPGFRRDITDREEYRELRSRIMKLIPEKSFVGGLLRDMSVCSVIESRGMGIMQHVMFNWTVDEFGDFIFKKESLPPRSSRLSDNIESLSEEQLKSFVEALFAVLKGASVNNFAEFQKNWIKDSRRLLAAYSGLDSRTHRLVSETVSELLKL